MEHNIKLLELVGINKVSDKYYIHIRLSCEYESDFFWNIDYITYNFLKGIFEDDGHHRYRLSLHSTLDVTRQQFISSITKTYREISDTLFFDCSLQYKSNLDSIKNSQSIDELMNLPFVFNHYPVTNHLSTHKISSKNVRKGITTTFSTILAVIGLLLIINSFSTHHPVNKTIMESTVVTAAQPHIAVAPVNTTINTELKTVPETNTYINDELNINTDTEIINSTTTNLPYLTIDDSLIYSISKEYVALTFDDGPSKYTKEIVDILKEYNVGGTFFFLGVNAKKHPDAVRYAFDNGYSIGNHTMNHPNLPKLTKEEQENEIFQSAKIIEEIISEKVNLFRPPYGAQNEQIIDLVQSQQLKTILWNKDPKDWNTKDSEKIVNYVRDSKAAGSIILLHESETVISALPSIIRFLQDQHLEIVNLQ